MIKRNVLGFVLAKASPTPAPASTLTTARIKRRTRRALCISGSSGRSADFHACVHCAVASGLGIEERFGFRLGFLEFRFFGFFCFLLSDRFVDFDLDFARRILVNATFDDKRFRRASLADNLRDLTRRRDLRHGRLAIIRSFPSFFFQFLFLERCVQVEFFDVRGEIGFVLFDEFFLDRAFGGLGDPNFI